LPIHTISEGADPMNQSSAQPAAHQQVTITVNTKPFEVTKEEISFAEVVDLAFGAVPAGENVAFTVTYRRGQGNKPSGSLVEGATVKVKDGMIFNVTKTDKS
jgi:Multiubiquitin